MRRSNNTQRSRITKRLTRVALAALAALAVTAPIASAKEAVDYFGTPSGSGDLGGQFSYPAGVAINQTGAGPADRGDIYVLDGGIFGSPSNRIERYSRNDNGTSDSFDDSYSFISAWGADVVSTGGTGDVGDAQEASYEICTVESQCKTGVASGGNGTVAGNGVLNDPQGIAVDSDTGFVYVSDSGNNRVNVYEGDGTFLRSFGYDVSALGAANAANEVQTLTLDADEGKFSLGFRKKSTSAVSFGEVGAGSTALAFISTTPLEGTFEVGQGISGDDFLGTPIYPPGTTVVAVAANGKSLTTSQPALASAGGNPGGEFRGHVLPRNASAQQIEDALNALSTIGGADGSVSVSGPNGGPFTIEFAGSLAGTDVPAVVAYDDNLTLGGGGGAASVVEQTKGGAYQVCISGSGDICRSGSAGSAPGQITAGAAIAVSPAGASGNTLFLADPGNFLAPVNRVNTYDLDGTNPGVVGSAASFGKGPDFVAVDSSGILYTASTQTGGKIERYDSEGANGSVGFLAPIAASGVDESQRLSVDATAGTYRLSYGGFVTEDIPFNLQGSPVNLAAKSVDSALEALPSIGRHNVEVQGGPGGPGAAQPYQIGFRSGLGALDASQLSVLPGSIPLSGGAGASVTTVTAGQPGLLSSGPTEGLAVASGALYVQRGGTVQQFGPATPPGGSAPPVAEDDRHATTLSFSSGKRGGLAVDGLDGRIYVPAIEVGGFPEAHGVYVLDAAGSAPTASLDSLSSPTATTVTAHGVIDPNGPPLLSYHFEYSADGSVWSSLPTVAFGTQEDPQAIDVVLNPAGGGFHPNTSYQVRLSVSKKFAQPVLTPPLSFTTDKAPPDVETGGAAFLGSTEALLEGSVNARGSSTTYRFQYGNQGPCSENPCAETDPVAAGSNDSIQYASARLSELEPDTKYDYRMVADNGAPGSPMFGVDRTFVSPPAKPPAHGDFPGPQGSDRAYELVSIPDSSGNPIQKGEALGADEAGDGNHAIYSVAGGTPISDNGSLFNQLLATRSETAPHVGGWNQSLVMPTLSETDSTAWEFFPLPDFSQIIGKNSGDRLDVWRTSSDGTHRRLFAPVSEGGAQVNGGIAVSDSGSRVVSLFDGEADYDQAHPRKNSPQLYDISTPEEPHLISLLPNGQVPSCGVATTRAPYILGSAKARWLSADGSVAFFVSEGDSCTQGEIGAQLYARYLETGTTSLVSGPTAAGSTCGATFVRSTQDAAFFWTQSALVSGDRPVIKCGGDEGGDVYRYGISTRSLECLTCTVVPGSSADVHYEPRGASTKEAGLNSVGVSPDGSAVYFISAKPLLAGTASRGIYRLDTSDGALSYVAPANDHTTEVGQGVYSDISTDGSVLVFKSDDPDLDQLGNGQTNGGTEQFYRYDHTDRSLFCVTCPLDGSSPRAPAAPAGNDFGHVQGLVTAGYGGSAISADGGVLAFYSPSALVDADQNTAGSAQDPQAGGDLYEWRDGQPRLVTDGLADWGEANSTPVLSGVSPSGRDIFFTAYAQYTPDALDGYRRLYDARIGGGFEYSPPPPPCPLEVCQGTPKGAPAEQPSGTSRLSGPGNATGAAPRGCPKGKRKVRRAGKVRCAAKKPRGKGRQGQRQHKRATHHRGTSR